mmetsp:Transcript_641/g.1088  ORF Transcript_641/g.1088 Transcript_641/m.1088 type:complete len:259 (-) Transcript_641:177-953(-)
MAAVMDPVDLLCRTSASPLPLPFGPLSPTGNALTMSHSFQSSYPGNQAWVPPVASGQLQTTTVSSSLHTNLPLPPGLDMPARREQPHADASMRQPPCPAIAPVHVWALEAKIKAEQAQSKQQEWAEKIKLQYLQGQEVLKVLQERRSVDDETPDETKVDTGSAAGGAFDRFVNLMGLRNESPRDAQQGAAIDSTPQSKAAQKWLPSTPQKTNARTSAWYRKSGEKENEFSPLVSKGAEAETPQTKTRRGRRRGKMTFQ